ncbi:MAG: glycoside hydrolase family 95 protein [Bacteroidota bacterium]
MKKLFEHGLTALQIPTKLGNTGYLPIVRQGILKMGSFYKGMLVAFFALFSIGIMAQSDLRLFYDEPAKEWTEALPLGNGRLGAMVYGTVGQEHIQFNEETLWTGKPRSYARQGAHKHLAEIRKLLFEGRQKEAMALMETDFMSTPRSLMAYQPFGDLIINFPRHENYSDYTRVLDIEQAVSRVSYRANGVQFSRETLVSEPDQLIAIHLKADRKAALDFSVFLDSRHLQKSLVSENGTQTLVVKPAEEPQRFFPDQPEESVLHGIAGLRVLTDGKLLTTYKDIQVKGATTATVFVAAHTNFVNFQDVSGNPSRDIKMALTKFKELQYDVVKHNHVQEYQSLFHRFKINFQGNSRTQLPTDERILQFWKNPEDPQLLALYVQYGRYLLISSSREGTQPANLQGIWNKDLNPAWKSKYTTNINAEMNYWPAEVTNLSDCHEPFLRLINECAVTGEIVAKEHYNADGWALHHNTDIWRGTAPINLTSIGTWVGGSGWVTHHIWEHYLFTQDLDFLREQYPVIQGSAQFYSDFLVQDPKTGWLVSSPSNSPEIGGLVAGPTMDHQIIRSLFRICIEAAEILGQDDGFITKLRAQFPQMAPNQIGKHGQLQEWLQDKDDPNEKHRHVSHLWAVHPGKDINWKDTPEVMKAAKQSLLFRGDRGTGWSLAAKINFWARFLDGDRAYTLIHNLLSPAEHPDRKSKGGSYPNLFDAHPPFQIDGNFGGTAGIVELLVQSHLGSIAILPALPSNLGEGSLTGVCARGGFELSFSWKNGKLDALAVKSKAGKECTIRYGDKTIVFDTVKGETYRFNGKLKQG